MQVSAATWLRTEGVWSRRVHGPRKINALFGLSRMHGVSECDATWHAGNLWFWGEVDTCGASIFIGRSNPRRP
jgi:hypothetical protein